MNTLRITLALLVPLSLSVLVACDAEVDGPTSERALTPHDYEVQSQLEELSDAELECTDWLDLEADEAAAEADADADAAPALACGEWTPVDAEPLPVDEGFRGFCNFWSNIHNTYVNCPGGGNLMTTWRQDCSQCAGQAVPSCGGWYVSYQETVCAIG